MFGVVNLGVIACFRADLVKDRFWFSKKLKKLETTLKQAEAWSTALYTYWLDSDHRVVDLVAEINVTNFSIIQYT